MAIRKQIIWDKKSNQFLGHCDYGDQFNIEGPETPATEALVFMLIGLNGKWKWPIGYFFINKINSTTLAELIKSALILTSNVGLQVQSVTCDGAFVNFDALNKLGCDIYTTYDRIKNYFKHPVENYNVYFVPDACHMLKLARNSLGTYKTFQSPEGLIKWCFIEELGSLQSNTSLKIANKLGPAHVKWQQNSMKVKLAAQTLSSSVADAIEFLSSLGLKEFESAQATVQFIRIYDRIFDFLNSRNPFGKGYKKPVYLNNLEMLENVLNKDIRYLFSLKDVTGHSLYESRRKTFIIGTAVAIKSVLTICRKILSPNNTRFKYLLTYKFSQDHIEILFSKIRRRFGCNNNPNVQQFKSCMKQILHKNAVSISPYANCSALDNDYYSGFDLKWARRQTPVNDNLPDNMLENSIEEFSNKVSCLIESKEETITNNILYYISGYIVRKIVNLIPCENCGFLLSNSNNGYSRNYTRLVNMKNRGGLISASDSVFKIVQKTEQLFKYFLNTNKLFSKNINKIIILHVKRELALDNSIFPECENCTNTDVVFDVPHKIQLMSYVCEFYLKIRLFAFGKRYSAECIQKISKRHQLSKLILFNNM